MKKSLSLIFAALICLATLCGCTTGSSDTSKASENIEAPSVDLSYDDVSYIIPGGNDSSATESQAANSGEPSESSDPSTESSAETSQPTETSKPEQQSGRFVVKVGKYDYDNTIEKQNNYNSDNNYSTVSIALLDITNETDKHYSVKITGKYLDKDGKVLKTETQEWDQFASGLQKYFLFRPKMLFDKFEYTIETTEYNGECWKNGFTMVFNRLVKEDRVPHPSFDGTKTKWVNAIGAEMTTTIDTPFPITFGPVSFLLFDANKNVIGIYAVGEEPLGWGPFEPMVKPQVLVYFSDRDDGKLGEWPEIFKGDVTGIVIITSVGKSQQ